MPKPPPFAATAQRMDRLRTEPYPYIVAEIEHRSGRPGRIHEIMLPPFLDPKHYVQGLSIEHFRSGKRKGASKSDARTYRGRCCWGPTCIYQVKSREQWENDCEINKRASEETRKKYPDIEFPDPRNEPRIVHSSVWDFYKAIGFDHKLRDYQDEEGKEIKYSPQSSPLQRQDGRNGRRNRRQDEAGGAKRQSPEHPIWIAPDQSERGGAPARHGTSPRQPAGRKRLTGLDPMSLEETHRVEKTKERLKAIAVECHARLTHLIRLKIAWAITQYPKECFTSAHVTLNKKLAKEGDASHKRWKTILARKSVEEAKKTLLSQKEKDQELNSPSRACNRSPSRIRAHLHG